MADRISASDQGYVSGDLSLFPLSLDDVPQLYEARNNAQLPLKQTLTYNGTTVVVDGDTSGFPPSGIIRIGPTSGAGSYEAIFYQTLTPNTFQGLIRGFAGSTQATWFPGQNYVSCMVESDHHNATKDAVINIEHDLGVSVNPEPASLNGILQAQEVRFLSPKPKFWTFPRKGTPPLTVRFQNFTSGYILRNRWDFGDGSTSLDFHAEHTYTAEGLYTVTLNVINSTGGQGVVTKTNYIEVNADDTVPFFYVNDTTNPYSTATAALLTSQGHATTPKNFLFVDQSDGAIVQRNWVFDDGSQVVEDDPDVHTIRHTYADPGSYNVTLLVVFSNGLIKTVRITSPLEVL